MLPPITSLDEGILLCRVFRYHRWVGVAARAGVVEGKRVWDWELSCETGCGNRATEWLDNYGFRLPGTQRQYYPTDAWRQSAGYDHNEYVAEYISRQHQLESSKAVTQTA